MSRGKGCEGIHRQLQLHKGRRSKLHLRRVWPCAYPCTLPLGIAMAPWVGEDLVPSVRGELVCSPGSGQELVTLRRALPVWGSELMLGRRECCLGHPAICRGLLGPLLGP